MKVEVLASPGCGSGQRTLALVGEVLRGLAPGATLELVLVTTAEEAERLRFPGSPTVRVDGLDVEPRPPTDVGLG
jgi:hypothetical protein